MLKQGIFIRKFWNWILLMQTIKQAIADLNKGNQLPVKSNLFMHFNI